MAADLHAGKGEALGKGSSKPPQMDTFVYDDKIVRAYLVVIVVWGVVAFLVGILVAVQLAWPKLNLGLSFTSFGRLRPLHTNAAIFAFAGNAVFAAVYHSTQRLCKARMFSDVLSWFHFWGWQAIIVAAAVTLAAGIHDRQGVCRAGVADRHGDRGGVGGLRDQLLRHAVAPPRAAHVRGVVVLHRHDRDDRRFCTSSTAWSCRPGC